MGIISALFTFITLVLTSLSYLKSVSIGRKKQAKKINFWLESENNPKGTYVLINTSKECVYNVFFFGRSNLQSQKGINKHGKSLDDVLGTKKNTTIFKSVEYLPPEKKISIREDMWNAMGGEHIVPEAFFTDSSGIQWYRHANGILEQYNYIKVLEGGYIGKHV